MLTYSDNIATCLRCTDRAPAKPGGGPCPCKHSGRNITDHAKAGDCPLSLYGKPLPPEKQLGRIVRDEDGQLVAVGNVDAERFRLVSEGLARLDRALEVAGWCVDRIRQGRPPRGVGLGEDVRGSHVEPDDPLRPVFDRVALVLRHRGRIDAEEIERIAAVRDTKPNSNPSPRP